MRIGVSQMPGPPNARAAFLDESFTASKAGTLDTTMDLAVDFASQGAGGDAKTEHTYL